MAASTGGSITCPSVTRRTHRPRSRLPWSRASCCGPPLPPNISGQFTVGANLRSAKSIHHCNLPSTGEEWALCVGFLAIWFGVKEERIMVGAGGGPRNFLTELSLAIGAEGDADALCRWVGPPVLMV